MCNPTQPLKRPSSGGGWEGGGVICCCFFRSFLRLPITWWVSHVSILPVVSTPWKSSLKYKADFSLAIWAPKDKIDSNELIVLAILSNIILSLSGSTNSAKDQQDSFWDQQSVRYCYWLTWSKYNTWISQLFFKVIWIDITSFSLQLQVIYLKCHFFFLVRIIHLEFLMGMPHSLTILWTTPRYWNCYHTGN